MASVLAPLPAGGVRGTPARHAAMLCRAPRRTPVQPAVRFDKQRPLGRGRQQLFATVIRVASGKNMLGIKVSNVCDVIKTKINLGDAVFARDRHRYANRKSFHKTND